MTSPLFLDTARMGQPRQRSIAAQMSLSQFWGEHGLSAKNDDLLRHGFRALSLEQQCKYYGLSDWNGIRDLKESLKDFVGVGADWQTHLASRTSKLMELAIGWLGDSRGNVLYPDCLWPAYRGSIQQQLGSGAISFAMDQDPQYMLESIVDAASSHKCGSLLLPAITHLGLTVPYAAVSQELVAAKLINRVVVDAAQEFAHGPVCLPRDIPMVYVTSAQKWLGGGAPMGMAFCSPEATSDLQQIVAKQSPDDSLLRFTWEQDGQELSETVTVMPLFATQAAAAELSASQLEYRYKMFLDNRQRLLSHGLRRYECLFDESHACGIVAFRVPSVAGWGTTEVRARLLELGLIASAFPGGLVRLSMPEFRLSDQQIDGLLYALSQLDGRRIPRAAAQTTVGVPIDRAPR